MGYFPFFIELSGQKGLVAGGGSVALRKVEKLLPYGPQLTVAARTFLPELEALSGIECRREPFVPQMLDGMSFVVAATNDEATNREIAGLCKERGILVNVVDAPQLCTFLFPAVVKDKDLSVGISTGGTSPTAAVWLKEQIQELLPEKMGEILEYLGSLRGELQQTVPAGKRSQLYAGLFDACMTKGRALTAAEQAKVLEELE